MPKRACRLTGAVAPGAPAAIASLASEAATGDHTCPDAIAVSRATNRPSDPQTGETGPSATREAREAPNRNRVETVGISSGSNSLDPLSTAGDSAVA
jgi:hypothetical protein